MAARSVVIPVLGIALGTLGGMLAAEVVIERRVERLVDERFAVQEAHLKVLAGRAGLPAMPVMAPDHGDELRRIREQLDQLLARGVPAGAAQKAESERPAPPRPPAPAQEEAQSRAQRILDDALAQGRWTEEDETRFQRAIEGAGPERMQEMAGRLSQAINSGRLRPAGLTGR